MMKTPAEILKEARIKAGFEKPTEAARAHDWVVSTYISHENGTRPISKKAAKLYARGFGSRGVKISEAALLGATGGGTVEDDVELSIPVIGESAVGLWRDTTLEDEKKRGAGTLRLPEIGGKGRRRRATQVTDNSANRFVLAGEYAIFEELRPNDIAELEPNDWVVVERMRGCLRERTVRRIRSKKGDRLELETYSTERKFTELLSYPSARAGDVIEIVGKVVGKYAELAR